VLLHAAHVTPCHALIATTPCLAHRMLAVTRILPTRHTTEYEVDFINNFTKLTALGAKFNSEQYLHPETTLKLKF
jgi:hypothetical protein